jgi:microcystin-dependent protein
MAQPYVGEIRMFAGNFAPAGWMFCEGQTLPISENEVLFQLIGTTYGGDGQETFALPNLQSRVPIHFSSAHQLAEAAGTEQVTLTTQQIPTHTHGYVVNGAVGADSTPTSTLPSGSPNVNLYRQATPSANLSPQGVGATGGSQPHTNYQPYLCVNFIISLYGLFPSPT